MSNVRGSAYLLAALSGLIWCISLVWTPTPPPKYKGLDTVRARIPQTLEGYRQMGENPISDTVRQALAAADIVSYTYEGGGGSVDMTLIGGTDRSALHDPRSCMVGAGWRIENDHTEDLPGTGLQARVCRVTNGVNPVDYEVLYLYVVGERTITQVTQIRTQMLLSALIGRKGTPVCFVRFMRPVPRGGADNPEAARLFRQFAGSAWGQLKIKEAIQTG